MVFFSMKSIAWTQSVYGWTENGKWKNRKLIAQKRYNRKENTHITTGSKKRSAHLFGVNILYISFFLYFIIIKYLIYTFLRGYNHKNVLKQKEQNLNGINIHYLRTLFIPEIK